MFSSISTRGLAGYKPKGKRKMKYYSMIIYTQDGEEAARFVKLRAPELMRKVDAAIELGAYAVVDAGEKEEQPEYIWQKMLDPEEEYILETNTSGIL